MGSYENLIIEVLDVNTPRLRYERILELLEKEKQLAKLQGYVELVKQTKEAMEKDAPLVARWIPEFIDK